MARNSNDNWRSKFFEVANTVFLALCREIKSTAGRINLAFDFMLFFIIIAYIVFSTTTSVVRIVTSVFVQDLAQYAGDASIMTMFLIFAAAAILCLVIMAVLDRLLSPPNTAK